MFEKVPPVFSVLAKNNDYSIYHGSHAYCSIELLTKQRTAEFIQLAKFVDETPWAHAHKLKCVIGTSNTEVVDGQVEFYDVAQFRVGTLATRGGQSKAYVCLAHTVNKYCGRLKSEKNNYFLRPIYELHGSELNSLNDIKSVLGFQLLDRDNLVHMELKPIFVKGK